ncbi:TRAP transporter large permease [Ferrimonas balearica]|nr:TRAP transporter large permease [Ferrimonas balearica]
MDALIALPILVVLMAIGLPVAWSFAGVLAYLVWTFDVNLSTLMLQGFRSLNSLVLIALPLFILTGYLMETGGIARRIVTFIGRLAGGRAGLGGVVVVSSAVFGAIAGTASAAVASMGTIMSNPMAERGYPRGYIASLLGISSLLGILIPPSITMILFAVATRQSVAACFAASIGPAILLILCLLIWNRLFVGTQPQITEAPKDPSLTLSRATLSALPALSLPIIILGGIYGGIFTPTEASAVAALAAAVVGFVFYRELTPRLFATSLVRTAETTGSIIVILLFSFMISRILSFERIPQDLAEAVQGFAGNPIYALLLVNAVLIIAGMLMDDVSVTVVVAPLFLPLITGAGVDPVQFAAIVACSVVMGANSPPMAPILYMSCRVCNASVMGAVKPALSMLICVVLPVTLATTYWPALSLTIPHLLGLN